MNDELFANTLIKGPNYTDEYGYSVLHHACSEGYYDTAMTLIDMGADTSFTPKKHTFTPSPTLLHTIIHDLDSSYVLYNDSVIKLFKLIIKDIGADPVDGNGISPMMQILMKESQPDELWPLVKALIKEGAYLGFDGDGDSPVVEIIKILHNENWKNDKWLEILNLAINKIMEQDPNLLTDQNTGLSVLHHTINYFDEYHDQLDDFMSQSGLHLNTESLKDPGITPFASYFSNLANGSFYLDSHFICHMLDKGAKTNIQSNSGNTPFSNFMTHGDQYHYNGDIPFLTIINKFIDSGANINHQDNINGRTGLMEYMLNPEVKKPEILKSTLEIMKNTGYDFSLTSCNNDSITHLAKGVQDYNAAQMLISYDPHFTKVNMDGEEGFISILSSFDNTPDRIRLIDSMIASEIDVYSIKEKFPLIFSTRQETIESMHACQTIKNGSLKKTKRQDENFGL